MVKHQLRYAVLYILLRIFQGFILLLPFYLVRLCGAAIGVIAFLTLPYQRKKIERNLAFAFRDKLSPDEIRKTSFGIFKNLGKNLAETLYLPRINSRNIDKIIRQKGIEKIDRALKEGKGAIILSAHLGNWELLGAYLGLKGYPVSVIARQVRVEMFDDILCGLRRGKNLNILYRDDAFKSAAAALRSNGCLGILSDQDIDAVDGIFVDFFGHPAYTPTGPVNLALITGAPIIPCYIVRNGKSHKIFVEDPIELSVTGDRKKDIIENTAKWSGITERYIRDYPSQWVWMHDRWKTKPVTTDEHKTNI